MSSSPYMQFYPADYLADTGHLSTLEHGAYLLLLMHYWMNRCLPKGDERLARVARLPLNEWSSIREAVLEFFDEVEGQLRHGRIDADMAELDEKRERLSIAGQKGGLASAKARQPSSQAQASVQQPLSILASASASEEKKKDIRAVAVATRPARDEAFEEFWKAYPKRDGANPKAPARKLFEAAVKSGVDPPAIIAGARAYAAAPATQVGTSYVAQAMTWLRQKRWEDHVSGNTQTAVDELERHRRECLSRPQGAETEVRRDSGVGEDRAGIVEELRSSDGVVWSESEAVGGPLAVPIPRPGSAFNGR